MRKIGVELSLLGVVRLLIDRPRGRVRCCTAAPAVAGVRGGVGEIL